MTISTQQSVLLSRLWFSFSKTTRTLRNHLFLFPAKSTHSTSSDSVRSRSLLKTNSTVQNVLCTAVHGRCSLLPKSHMVLRYTRRRHFIQTRKNCTASLRGFSPNLQVLDSIMCRSVVPNFAAIEQRMCKLPT